MKAKRTLSVLAGALAVWCLQATAASATTYNLFEWKVNVDGSVTAPAFTFNAATGAGTLTAQVTGIGAHFVGGFFDLDIDDGINGFSNETATATNTPSAGQSWEIDEPGFADGDIFDNFEASSLDNDIGVSVFGDTAFPDDVSMAIGWDFLLGAGELANVSFVFSNTAPGGFFLTQTDPDSPASIFLGSTIRISDGGSNVVPEPGTMVLLGSGLLGLAAWRRRARS